MFGSASMCHWNTSPATAALATIGFAAYVGVLEEGEAAAAGAGAAA